MSYVILELSNLTEANKAQRLLRQQRIRSRILRLPHRPGKSCAFGLRLREADWETAVPILERYGVRPRSVTREGDDHDLP